MLYNLWERYRVIIIAAAIIILAALGYLLNWLSTPAGGTPLPLARPAYALPDETPVTEQQGTPAGLPGSGGQGNLSDAKTMKPAAMYVDVKGSVNKPGVYPFTEGDRVQTAIALAGGLLPEADINRVNLAQPLSDGAVVWIPAKTDGEGAVGDCPCLATSSVSFTPLGQNEESKVNLNRATLQQLTTLPGIGETRAQAIIAYREQHGPFTHPEQLKQVSGIGERMYQQLADKISAP